MMCHFNLPLENKDTEDELQKQAGVALVLRSQQDNSTTANVFYFSS